MGDIVIFRAGTAGTQVPNTARRMIAGPSARLVAGGKCEEEQHRGNTGEMVRPANGRIGSPRYLVRWSTPGVF